ncbi:MAG: ankyrin repeat domain-containing protein, partial [Clostridia bacterium]|nr:ankyrin repeat domain-containing protein [Clostridia bacterium]
KIGTSANQVGWLHDGSLTDEAKRLRKNIINQYKQKITNAKDEDVRKKTEKVREESEDSDVDLLIAEVIIDITEGNYIEAEARFDIIIQKAPNSPIGYVGKALAIVSQENGEKNALNELRKAFQYTPADDDEKDNLEFFINYEYGENDTTLLMVAAANYDYDAVKYLVDSGADIDAESAYNVTALWYVCRKKPDETNVEAARKIAKLLLDNGAEIDIKNKGGIALYNKETDYEIARMIKEKFPDAEQGAAPAKSGGGCYVATAVYGSYDCPQVWTLRRYRDYTLAETWYGRAFIKTYYAISPTLVKWFGHTDWFKKMWQGKLDRMVAKLQDSGVESTPYKDKEW